MLIDITDTVQLTHTAAEVDADIDGDVRGDIAQTKDDAWKAQARNNIGANYSNPNLLDNPFFTINQRSATSANNGYGVDRWRGNYDVNADGSITIRQFALQYADYPLNVPITMSAIYGDDNAVISGTLTLTDTTTQKYFATNGSVIQLVRNSSNAFMVWTGTTCKVKAVKIEVGTVSTLANDSAPSYSEELAKCQYYYIRYSGIYGYIGNGVAYSATSGSMKFPKPIMAKNGTLRLSGTIYLNSTSGRTTNAKPCSVIVDTSSIANAPYAFANCTTSGLTVGDVLEAQFRDDTSYIEISADL